MSAQFAALLSKRRRCFQATPSASAAGCVCAECICAWGALTPIRMWHHESVSRRSRPLDSIACAPAAKQATAPPPPPTPSHPPPSTRVVLHSGCQKKRRVMSACSIHIVRARLYYLHVCTGGGSMKCCCAGGCGARNRPF